MFRSKIAIWGFSVIRQTAMPIRIVPRFCAGDAVGLKCYLTVVEIHRAAKISMLRLNIGSGMLRLSSCMLSIGLGPKCEQDKGGQPPPLP